MTSEPWLPEPPPQFVESHPVDRTCPLHGPGYIVGECSRCLREKADTRGELSDDLHAAARRAERKEH